MTKVDLITGFLGAGKTSFLIEYAKHFVDEGKKVAIIVNDYGAINVDRLLLHQELGDSCQLEMVISGDKDCSRRRLKTKLITMALEGYNQVLVEPSGLFQVDDFFDLLYEEPLERWYERGNVLTIVEATLERNLSTYAKYILTTQIASAGTVVISKSKSQQDADNLLAFLEACLKKFHCESKIKNVYYWKKGKISKDDFAELAKSSYRSIDVAKLPEQNAEEFESLFFFYVDTPTHTLEETVRKLMADENAGNIFRLKGFLRHNEKWIEVNATKTEITIRESAAGQEVFIVIGEELNEELIGSYWKNYKIQG